ncbi:MAG: hypothetical protein VKO21_11125 [Candidatus Sericytochromatia bacterium]|nr:hypothetical protein [Candidatus Sericytochromatia bacterium]
MSQATLPQHTRAPAWRRWWEYQAERFPLATHLVGILLFFGLAHGGAVALATEGPVPVGGRTALAFFLTFQVFLLLRVMDEFKDFADDAVNHPERVVQRGVVTLPELKVLGIGIGVSMAILALALGREGVVGFAAVTAFSGLMRVEFFIGPWLRQRVLTYALLHQGIVPLLCVAVGRLAAGPAGLGAEYLLVVGVAVGLGLVFELTRKARAPEEELETLATYTRVHGPFGASLAAFVALALAVLAASWLALRLALPVGSLVLVLLSGFAGTLVLGVFAVRPFPETAKVVRIMGTVVFVLIQAALVLGLWVQRGFAW